MFVSYLCEYHSHTSMKSQNIKAVLRYCFGIITLLGCSAFNSWAQPSNDNCGGSISLTPNSTCNPTAGTTSGATQSQTSTVGNPDDDVWYSFVATQSQHTVQVVGGTAFNAVVQVFSGTCGGSSIALVNNAGNGQAEYANLTNLFVGITYWVRVYHFGTGSSNTPTFNICVSDPLTEPACNPNSLEPSNSMTPCSGVPKICEVNGFCGTTQGFTNPANPSGPPQPYTQNSWPQLSSAFCGSIENNSFMYFTASQSTVQLRIYGSCSGGGNSLQIMFFTVDNPVPPSSCDNGPVTSYGCYGAMNLNASPNGVAVSFSGMTPGQDYYIMIDGNAGSICNYKIGADFGVQTSVNSSPSVANICLGNSVTLTASGGNGTYNWNPNPALNQSSGSSVVATPTTTGQHFFVVNSQSPDPSCPATSDTSFVNVQTTPAPNAGIDDSVCFGNSIQLNGQVSNSSNSRLWQFIPPSGTSPTVNFAPNFSTLNATVTVNQPGLYRFILRETSSLCGQYRDTVNILVINPTQTLTPTPPSCYGLQDGEVEITAPFASEFSLDSGATWQASNVFTGLDSGYFQACARNYLGCMICSEVFVPSGVQMGLSVSNDTIVCQNGTAQLSALGTGGTGIVYNWGHTGNQGAQQSVSPINTQYFSVYASNSQGCQSAPDSIFVEVLPPLNGSVSPDTFICPGYETVLLASANGGNDGPYTFTWSNGTTASGYDSQNPVTPDNPTTYQVTVTDNCESSPYVMSIFVDVAPLPQPSFMTFVDSLCSPASFEVYNTTDPTVVSSILWEVSNGQFEVDTDTLVTGMLPAGNYNVQLTITSVDGCIDSLTQFNFLTSLRIPDARFLFSPSPVKMLTPDVSFVNLSSNGATNYYWNIPSGNPSSSTAENPETTYPEGVVDNYPVTLYAYDDFGCMDSITEIVRVISEVIAFVPNSFTPGADEHNPLWRPVVDGIDLIEFEVEVRNRWGELIWESKDPDIGWDGTYQGVLVPSGAYVYYIKARDLVTREPYIWRGIVNVLR